MIKIIKTILLAGGSLLVMMTAARAEPISIAIGGWLFTNTALGAIAGLNTLIAATQFVLGTALSVGISLVGGLSSQGQTIDPGEYKSTFQSAESSEINVIGRGRVGGLQSFGNTIGTDRYRVILHSATELVAIEEYYLGGRPVTVESDGQISSPPYAKPTGSWVYWKTKPGTGDEVAWTDLKTAFPDIWTDDHRARGIAQSLIKYISPGITTAKFGNLYQGGEPKGEIEGRFARCYDPRDVSQDMSDPETWKWSNNGILCPARIMLAYPDLTVDSFDWDFIADEADKADVLVATKTGTEPRSRCSGIWRSEDKRGDTMSTVLTSVGAEIVMSDDNLIRFRLIDDDITPEIAFTEQHMVNWDWKSGPEAVERPNICRIKFYSSERNYDMGDIDMTGIAWARIEDEIARYGEKVMDINLPFCPSASQAQRIGRREFLLARADTGRVEMNLSGMAAWGLSYASWEFSDLEETLVCKILPPRMDDEAGRVEIPFSVWPDELVDSPWNPATMEAAAPDPIPSLEYQSDLPTPATPQEASIVQYADLSYEVRLKFTGAPGVTDTEAVYRTYTGGLPNAYSSMTEYGGSGSGWFAYVADDIPGEQVDFKVRFISGDDVSYYSDLLSDASLDVDNSAPAMPSLNVVKTDGQVGGIDWKFDWSVSVTDMNVARLVITGVTNTNPEGRPGIVLSGHEERSDGQTFTINATAYSSNGTASPTATYSFTTPS